MATKSKSHGKKRRAATSSRTRKGGRKLTWVEAARASGAVYPASWPDAKKRGRPMSPNDALIAKVPVVGFLNRAMIKGWHEKTGALDTSSQRYKKTKAYKGAVAWLKKGAAVLKKERKQRGSIWLREPVFKTSGRGKKKKRVRVPDFTVKDGKLRFKTGRGPHTSIRLYRGFGPTKRQVGRLVTGGFGGPLSAPGGTVKLNRSRRRKGRRAGRRRRGSSVMHVKFNKRRRRRARRNKGRKSELGFVSAVYNNKGKKKRRRRGKRVVLESSAKKRRRSIKVSGKGLVVRTNRRRRRRRKAAANPRHRRRRSSVRMNRRRRRRGAVRSNRRRRRRAVASNPRRRRRRGAVKSNRGRRRRRRHYAMVKHNRGRRHRVRRNPFQAQLAQLRDASFWITGGHILVGAGLTGLASRAIMNFKFARQVASMRGAGGAVARAGVNVGSTLLVSAAVSYLKRFVGGSRYLENVERNVLVGGVVYTLASLAYDLWPAGAEKVIPSIGAPRGNLLRASAGASGEMGWLPGRLAYPGEYPGYGGMGMVMSPEDLVSGESMARQVNEFSGLGSSGGAPVPLEDLRGYPGQYGGGMNDWMELSGMGGGMGDWVEIDPNANLVKSGFDPGTETF